ncbi:hypothetical protein DFR42_11455 [Undibacterium pigrum]|uniref:Uncharacterized protein n=2 Tax=Undibacterium pigrum TaxID=401470 RepID=A0A318IPA5_9BURK|nr:hypothetical protein DFR42_11455 [Undibacterium pigrum]
MGLPGMASAACSEYPTVKAEILRGPLVLQGRAIKEKVLQEDADDPYGVTATEFTIQVEAWFKGRSKRNRLIIRDENTSSRFAMDLHKSYLLFMQPDPQYPGQYYVDSCGNSNLMAESRTVLKIINNMKAAKTKKAGNLSSKTSGSP